MGFVQADHVKTAWNCNYDPVTEAAMKVMGMYLGDVLKSNLVLKKLAREIFSNAAAAL